MEPSNASIVGIIGVYDAAGSLRGEISYVLQKIFAGKHCALCDITHGTLRKRPAWVHCSSELSARHGIEVRMAHLDDAPRSILDRQDFRAPAIFIERADGSVEPILSAEDLASCGRSPERLIARLEDELGKRR